MPPIRSQLLTSYYTAVVTTILLLGEIILSYSCYIKKKLVYIVIAAPSSRQPFLYAEYTQVNIRSSYNI